MRERLGIPPVRGNLRFVTAIGIDALGSGLYFPIAVLYFVVTTELTAVQVGWAFSIAGAVGIPATLAVGTLVDRWGAKRVLIGANVIHATAYLGFPFAETLPQVAVVLVIESLGIMGFWGAYLPFVALISQRGERELWYGFLAALRNVGFALGGVVAAVILDADKESWFHLAVLVNAASFGVAVLLLLPVPDPGRAEHEHTDGSWRAVLADRGLRWLYFTNTCYAIAAMSLPYAFPLYVVTMLELPGWVAGAMFTLNSVLIGLLQSPLIKRLTGAVRWVVVAAGFVLMGSAYGLFWVADLVSAGAAVVLVLVAAAAFSVGEMTCDPVITALAAESAPEGNEGRTMAGYQLSWAIALTIAPALLTWLLSQGAAVGWGGHLGLVALGLLGLAGLVAASPRIRSRLTNEVEAGVPA